MTNNHKHVILINGCGFRSKNFLRDTVLRTTLPPLFSNPGYAPECIVDQPFSDDDEAVWDNSNEQTHDTPTRPPKALQDEVYAALIKYRDRICTIQGSGDTRPILLLFGKEISSGIPDRIITHINKKCTSWCGKSDFDRLSIDDASDIFEIVKQICDKHNVL